MIGWITPRAWIDRASSASASSWKMRRGWPGCGSMPATGISWTDAGAGAAFGVEADRRLLLHLAEQGGEAAAEPGRALLRERLAHAATFVCRGSRPISSRASAI